MMQNQIWKLEGNQFEKWLELEDPALENPNGLLAEPDRLVVGAWGKMREDFSTDVPGHLKAVDYQTKKITDIGPGDPIGNLDGVEPDGQGGYLVTDWISGGLYDVGADGKAQMLMDLNQGSADFEARPGWMANARPSRSRLCASGCASTAHPAARSRASCTSCVPTRRWPTCAGSMNGRRPRPAGKSRSWRPAMTPWSLNRKFWPGFWRNGRDVAEGSTGRPTSPPLACCRTWLGSLPGDAGAMRPRARSSHGSNSGVKRQGRWRQGRSPRRRRASMSSMHGIRSAIVSTTKCAPDCSMRR